MKKYSFLTLGVILILLHTKVVSAHSPLEITITTNPVGQSITVDGLTYSAPQNFMWDEGSSHTIATSSPQKIGTRYIWQEWNDGGAMSHTIVVTSATTTYTANFITQYSLSINNLNIEGGSVSISPPSADGFYDDGTSVEITAVANSNWKFSQWGGDLTGIANPQTISITAPRAISVTFVQNIVTTTSVLPAEATYGDQSVELIATVDPSPDGGTVQFYNGSDPIGSPQNIVQGIAALNYNPSSLNAGTYSITAIYSGSGIYSGSNSQIANLVIKKAILVVIADNQTKTYNGANPVTFTLQYFGWRNGIEPIDRPPEANSSGASGAFEDGTPVGNYPDVIDVSGGEDDNYEFDYDDGDLTITKAKLTVTADDQSKTYGQANPVLTFHYSGWMNGVVELIDTPPLISTTVNGTTGAGTYINAITLSGGFDNNYEFTFVNGDFEVKKAVLTATADDMVKNYGDPNPTLTFKYSGWVNDSESIDTPPTPSTTIDGTTGYGTYLNAITLTGGFDNNYTFNLVAGDFIINPRPITIEAIAANKFIGQADPALTYKITAGSLANNDLPSEYRSTGECPGNYDIIVKVSDNYALTYKGAVFTINPVTIDASASGTPVPANTTASLKATVSSSQTGDLSGITVKFTIDDGNGFITSYNATTNSTGFASINTENLSVGLYKVTAEVSSGCNNNPSSIAYLAVFDPNGGYVTGGGWINSPLGAYIADPTLAGKANFGFVSQYKKGSTTPSGNTEFQFQTGNLNFSSTSYSFGSLVVAGSKAIYKGVGTINGTGSYQFMVSAVDGQINGGDGIDKFRIKIMDGSSVVYDNMLGKDENLTPTTAISGGSIVIHPPSGSAKGIAPEFGITAYPNPFTNHVYFELQLEVDANVRVEVYNLSGLKLATIFNDLTNAFVNYQFEYTPESVINGTLIYRVIINDRMVFTGKLIRE